MQVPAAESKSREGQKDSQRLKLKSLSLWKGSCYSYQVKVRILESAR